MEKFEPNSIGKIGFSISWTIGTAIFIANILTQKPVFFICGIIYIFIAGFVNISLLLIEVVNIILSENRKEHIISAIFLLLNIPIAAIYILIIESTLKNHTI